MIPERRAFDESVCHKLNYNYDLSDRIFSYFGCAKCQHVAHKRICNTCSNDLACRFCRHCYQCVFNTEVFTNKCNDFELIKKMVCLGANVNYTLTNDLDMPNFTPLCVAIVFCNNLEIVKYLVKQGADITRAGAVVSIANECNPEMGKYLIDNGVYNNKHGPEVVEIDFRGESVLNYTMRIGAEKTTRYLIDNLPDINQLNGHGHTALTYAIKNDKLEMAKYIVKNNPGELNFLDKWGKTALDHALHNDKLEIAGYLVEYRADTTELIRTIRDDNLEMAKKLINYGVDINKKDYFGESALEYILQNDKVEIFEYINTIKPQGFLEQEDEFGSSLLQRIITHSCGEIILYLNESGTSVSHLNKLNEIYREAYYSLLNVKVDDK